MSTYQDKLIEVKNFFYAGFYERVVKLNAIYKKALTDIENIEFESLMLRATACLSNMHHEQQDVSSNDETFLATQCFLGFWYSTYDTEKEQFLDTLKNYKYKKNNTIKFLLSSALCCNGKHRNASKALQLSYDTSTDLMALHIIQLCFFDLWKDAPKKMALCTLRQDLVILKLANAVVHIGEAKYQDAFSCYCDAEDDCLANDQIDSEVSVFILNGKAVCSMFRGDWDDAYSFLQEAYTKNSVAPYILCNLITCSLRLHQMTTAEKYLSLLQEVEPNHFIFNSMSNLDKAFDNFICNI